MLFLKILYIYDIKAKNRKKFNRTKRLFYYHLNKMNLGKEAWKTKSTILVSPKQEKMMDSFFQAFGDSIEVYKILTEIIEEL